MVWGKRAEGLHKVLAKGSNIFVEGSLRTSSYDDKEGNKKYRTEITAQRVILCGRPNGQTRAPESPEAPASDAPIGDDEMPF